MIEPLIPGDIRIGVQEFALQNKNNIDMPECIPVKVTRYKF